MHHFTPDEIALLLKAIANARDKAIVHLALDHGLRSSEIGLLDIGDYFPGKTHLCPDRIVLKRVKGSIGGEAMLGPEATIALRKWLRVRGRNAGPLFITQRRTAISRNTLDDLMKKYCENAGISPEKAHFHALKHTCALQTLRLTRSLVSVQLKLGYASLQSALPYARVLQSEFEGVAARSVTPSLPTESGYVYFVETEDGQHVKIGFSTRPRQRFTGLGTLRPSSFAIRLIGSFPASRETESWLHQKFESARDNGEWFRKTPELARLIRALVG